MQDSDHEIPAAARQHIYFANATLPMLATVGLWALYAGYALFGIDVLQLLKPRNLSPRDFNPAMFYFWAAMIGTVGFLSYAWFGIRRAMYLANHGIPVVCEVVKVGRISANGWVRVDYKYQVDGTTYKQSLSTPEVLANEYGSGARPLEIVYDPRNPKRVMEMSDVFPKSTFSVDEQDSQTS